MSRLRALTPPWPISGREARWIAEQQADLLLAESGITEPAVPDTIVTALDGVTVYPLAKMPVEGLFSASQASERGGQILIDGALPRAEQRLTLLYELKHLIDGDHHDVSSKVRGVCADFALNALMPATWLHADWQDGRQSLHQLADRYQVPVEAMERRLHDLGLRTLRPPPRRHAIRCHWQPARKSKRREQA